MTPAQFLARMKRNEIAPAYLFLGAEAYQRRRCRQALLDATLAPEERENGVSHYDLTETPVAAVLDDARSLSLFASRRVIVATNAEVALQRQKTDDEDEGQASADGANLIAGYVHDPTPGVVLVLEAVRFDFEGEQKKKLDRVRNFYSAIDQTVELRRFSIDDAMVEARDLARRAGIVIEPAALALLVESLGADVARIA